MGYMYRNGSSILLMVAFLKIFFPSNTGYVENRVARPACEMLCHLILNINYIIVLVNQIPWEHPSIQRNV